MNFFDVSAITIPEGPVVQIKADGKSIWKKWPIVYEDIAVKDTGARLVENWNLTPSSSNGVANSEYFTFKEIPVEPGATYYSQYGTRSWFLDSEKNNVKTLNLTSMSGTGSDVKYQFVVPSSARYISISYNYSAAGTADNVFIRKEVV